MKNCNFEKLLKPAIDKRKNATAKWVKFNNKVADLPGRFVDRL